MKMRSIYVDMNCYLVLCVRMATILSGLSVTTGDKTLLNYFSSIVLILTWQQRSDIKQPSSHVIDNLWQNIRITVFHCLVQNDFGDTALVAAVDKGYLHIVEILVKNGSNVNYRNKV